MRCFMISRCNGIMLPFLFSRCKNIALFLLLVMSIGKSARPVEPQKHQSEERASIGFVQRPIPAQQKKTLCNDIAAVNFTSIPFAMPVMMGDAITDPYAFYNFLDQSIMNPQPMDRRKRAFKILASAEQKKIAQDPSLVWQTESLIEPLTWQDLNLLSGSKDTPVMSLTHILTQGRTHTEMGKAYFAGLIARPTDNIQLLSARQAFIEKLASDDALFSELDSLVKQLGTSETLLTGLWDLEMMGQFLEMNYSKMPLVASTINESSLCLEIKSLIKLAGIGTAGLFSVSIPVIMGLHGLSKIFLDKPAINMLGNIFNAIPVIRNRWVQGIVALGMGSIAALSVKQSVNGLHNFVLIESLLRQRFVHIGMYHEAAASISKMVAKKGLNVPGALTFSSDIVNFFDDQMASDPQLASLENLLQAETFAKGTEKETQYIFSRGNTLAAYYLMTQAKEKFENMMAGLGELDAYLTIAKLLREARSSRAPWTLVSYKTNAITPTVALTNFWSPFLDPATVILNSVNLGIEFDTANIIATGPNSAGKSTMLKSIALAIVLAQSIGIAPASAMTLTPYSYLVTYMNVADSLVDKESRFQAEARRIFEYGDKLDYLARTNKFSFAIFDEIFSGTSPIEGADLGKKVAKIFGDYLNCTNIVATHFELLTSLEKETSGRFVNFRVSVEQNKDGSIRFDEHGKIIRTYKFIPGVSQQHIAREVFKERGDNTRTQFFNRCFA